MTTSLKQKQPPGVSFRPQADRLKPLVHRILGYLMRLFRGKRHEVGHWECPCTAEHDREAGKTLSRHTFLKFLVPKKHHNMQIPSHPQLLAGCPVGVQHTQASAFAAHTFLCNVAQIPDCLIRGLSGTLQMLKPRQHCESKCLGEPSSPHMRENSGQQLQDTRPEGLRQAGQRLVMLRESLECGVPSTC